VGDVSSRICSTFDCSLTTLDWLQFLVGGRRGEIWRSVRATADKLSHADMRHRVSLSEDGVCCSSKRRLAWPERGKKLPT